MHVSSTRKPRSLLNSRLDVSWPSILAIGLVAVMMALISLASVPQTVGWLGVGLAELMLAIAVIDWRHFIIPDRLNATAFVLGLVHAWWQDRAPACVDGNAHRDGPEAFRV